MKLARMSWLLLLGVLFACCAFLLPVIPASRTSAASIDLSGDIAKGPGEAGNAADGRSAAGEEAARTRLLDTDSSNATEVARAAAELINLNAISGAWSASERAALLEHARQLQDAGATRDDKQILAELTALGDIYILLNDMDATLALLDAANSISVRTAGPDDPSTADINYKQGEVHRLRGDYAAARLMHQRALDIKEKAFGPDHPEVAASLTALSWIMRMIGDYPAGIEMATRAVEIRETAQGRDLARLPMSLSSLAGLYRDMGEFSKARPIYERALRLWEAALGPDGSNVSIALTNIAPLLSRAGEHRAAKTAALRALSIREKNFPAGNYMIARSLVNLADVLQDGGDDVAAAAALERALPMQETTFGARNIELARTLGMLSEIRLRQGDIAEALELALRVESLARRSIQETARVLTESQILRYEAARTSGLDVALSVAASIGDRGQDATVVLGPIWDEVIRSRAMVLDEIGSRHREVARASSPVVVALAAELAGARRRLAQLSVRGPDATVPADYARAFSAAQRSAERAEQSLAEASSEFRLAADVFAAGLDDVRRARPPGAALVAYLKYNHRAPGAKRAPIPTYAALVLEPDKPEPVMVRLGPAATLEPLVESWRSSVGSDPRLASDHSSDVIQREAGNSLRSAIWDPLAGALRGSRQVLVVPDAALSFVNLAALPDSEGRYLVESGPLIHYLSAERRVVGAGGPPPGGRGLLALGGPDFDLEPGLARRNVDDSAPSHETMDLMASYRGSGPTCEGFQTVRFDPLPASVVEARQVRELWEARGFEGILMTGTMADEGSFKRLAGRQRMLHLATHGFLLLDECTRDPGPATEGDAPAENPMLLSGLVLAGANRRDEVLSPDQGEDGILTAEEIASLDLSGVEWAVLSGCETGLGRVLSGEGILGLRRAFEVAGARTLIMSLWKVEDEATRAWMSNLYEARMSGLSTAEAMRQASLRSLATQREHGRTTHPFFWGGFVATGDWR